jgi:hypothetical protein
MFRLNSLKEPEKGFPVTISSGTDKTCRVRFPTDAEWCERVRKIRVYRTPVGRDMFESNAPGQADVDLALFTKIRLDADSGIDFDSAEASKVITKLDSCRIIDVSRDGKQFKIAMEVPLSEVSITLKSPTLRQSKEYEDGSMKLRSGRRTQEWRSFLEPAGELFKEVFVSQEGYADDTLIPIIHQYAAIRELLDQGEEAIGEGIVLPE